MALQPFVFGATWEGVDTYVPLIPLFGITMFLRDDVTASGRYTVSRDRFEGMYSFDFMVPQEQEQLLESKRRLQDKYPAISRFLGHNYRQNIYNSIYDCIQQHNPVPPIISTARIEHSNTRVMAEAFTTSEIIRFGLRTFSGMVGFYSLGLFEGEHTRSMVLPVIHPRNLYYQRLHLMLTGSYDLSKVIFLIDETLKDQEKCGTGLYKFYSGRIQPSIVQTSAQAWFVPQQVIAACFPHKLELPYETVADIKENRNILIGSFKRFIRESYVDMYSIPKLNMPWEEEEEQSSAIISDSIEVAR